MAPQTAPSAFVQRTVAPSMPSTSGRPGSWTTSSTSPLDRRQPHVAIDRSPLVVSDTGLEEHQIPYDSVDVLVDAYWQTNPSLGYVQLDGKWMTEEESYRARGFVRYEGEWMTPAEAQAAQSAYAAEEARRDAEAGAREAEARAEQAERRAEEAEERAREAEEGPWRKQDPVYWGSWGYGLTYWPSTPIGDGRPGNRPAQRPSGGRR